MLSQQPPQSQGVGLHAVCAADNQYGAIQNGKGAFSLGGQVCVTRGIHQGDLQRGGFQNRLLGKNGDTPLAFQVMGIQECIPVIHPSQGAFCAGAI